MNGSFIISSFRHYHYSSLSLNFRKGDSFFSIQLFKNHRSIHQPGIITSKSLTTFRVVKNELFYSLVKKRRVLIDLQRI